MPAWMIPAAIAAGSAIWDKLNKPKPVTTTQTADPRQWNYFQQLWNQGQAAGQQPMDPNLQGASDYYGGARNAGMQGMQALGGDPRALQGMMNPYEQQVMDASQPFWEQARKGAMNTVNDRYTQSGAFGGSRQAIAQGVALGNIANQQAQTNAGMRYQGYNDAMGRAGQMANMGMGGAAGGMGIGQYWQNRPFDLSRQAMGAIPGGGQTAQSVQSNPMATGLGTFATLWGLPGMPWNKG